MLIHTTVKVISGKPDSDVMVVDKTNGDLILFNARNVTGIKVRASTKSSFMFIEDIMNSKGVAHYVESEDTVANLKTRANYTWNNLYIDLPLYPNNDTTQSTVTTSVYCDSISYVIKDQTATASRCYVIYYEGSKRRKCLCNYSIRQVRELADSGDLTTTM